MAKSATAVREKQQAELPAKTTEKVVEKVKSIAKAAKPAAKTQSGSGKGSDSTFFSRSMDFLRDVRSELRKVVTPSRNDVRNMTTVVIITVFAIAFYFWVIDAILGHAVQAVLRFLGGTAQ